MFYIKRHSLRLQRSLQWLISQRTQWFNIIFELGLAKTIGGLIIEKEPTIVSKVVFSAGEKSSNSRETQIKVS